MLPDHLLPWSIMTSTKLRKFANIVSLGLAMLTNQQFFLMKSIISCFYFYNTVYGIFIIYMPLVNFDYSNIKVF